MKTKLVKIGNSKGVRIPKPLIEQSGIGDEIEMILEKNQIIIRSLEEKRVGWEQSFKKMHEAGDDQLLDEDLNSDWDDSEWDW